MTAQTTDPDVNATQTGAISGDVGPAKADQSPRAARQPASGSVTPCYGMWQLFDATDWASHQEARNLCAQCPIIAACAQLLNDVIRESGSHGAPDGTWAGRGFSIGKAVGRSTRGAAGRPRKFHQCGTESAYQSHHHYGEDVDELCAEAHRAHNRARQATRRRKAA